MSGAFGPKIRLAYFEARLYLDGDANSHTLTQFGYTRQQASVDIQAYFAINPRCAHYCPHRKAHILDRRFKPKLLPREKLAGFATMVDSVFLAAYKRPPAVLKNAKPAPKMVRRRPR